jgi:hypothetical protein
MFRQCSFICRIGVIDCLEILTCLWGCFRSVPAWISRLTIYPDSQLRYPFTVNFVFHSTLNSFLSLECSSTNPSSASSSALSVSPPPFPKQTHACFMPSAQHNCTGLIYSGTLQSLGFECCFVYLQMGSLYSKAPPGTGSSASCSPTLKAPTPSGSLWKSADNSRAAPAKAQISHRKIHLPVPAARWCDSSCLPC